MGYSEFVAGDATVQAMYKTAELQLYENLSIRSGRRPSTVTHFMGSRRAASTQIGCDFPWFRAFVDLH